MNILFLVLLMIGSIATKRVYECNRAFLMSMGFMGVAKPTSLHMEMCPGIDLSCCSETDQLVMHQHWLQSREEENLEDRLKNHREQYEDLLDKANEVYERAKKTLEKVKSKSISNCKILAQRLVLFRIDLIAPQIEKGLGHMHEFLIESQRG